MDIFNLGLVVAVILLIQLLTFRAVLSPVAVGVLLVAGSFIIVLCVHPPRQDVLYPVFQLLGRGQVLVVGHVQPHAVRLEHKPSSSLERLKRPRTSRTTYICDVDHTDLRSEKIQLEGFLPVCGQLLGDGRGGGGTLVNMGSEL